jgi:hypothetical protein
VFKGSDENSRILGISVIKNDGYARIYILTSDKKLNCLEIRRKGNNYWQRASKDQSFIDNEIASKRLTDLYI